MSQDSTGEIEAAAWVFRTLSGWHHIFSRSFFSHQAKQKVRIMDTVQ